MTAATLTLTDFLLARIAEDEAVATDGRWHFVPYEDRLGGRVSRRADGLAPIAEDWHGRGYLAVSEHIARHDPARVLAECEAKRRIVETVAAVDDGALALVLGDDIKRLLALPYADHPDYREEWSGSSVTPSPTADAHADSAAVRVRMGRVGSWGGVA